MPKGWKVSIGALTAPNGYTWINNGKSLFKKYGGGGYRAVLIKNSNLGLSNG